MPEIVTEPQSSGETGEADGAEVPKPPWGDDFDAQRAWSLVQNLRGDKDKLTADLAQAAADREELDKLRNEKLTADEKALKDATEKAAAEARSAAEAELRPKFQTAQLKSVAAQVITDSDQLASFMAVTDPGKFAGDDGEIDEAKVMGHLTALFGARQAAAPARNWGQTSAGHAGPAPEPGSGGKAEAQRRFGTKP